MRVGWLADTPEYPGGAEMTSADFLDAAPDGVEIVPCPPGEVADGLDRYVVQNCVRYETHHLEPLTAGAPVFKYWHDVGPWLQDGVRALLDRHAIAICCSPAQADHMGITSPILIPPPIDVARFAAAGAQVNGSRAGACSVGSWRNWGKAPHHVAAWAMSENYDIDFYGGGPFAPDGAREVAYDEMPALLARYQTFVFLPAVIEPFGRAVAEAWAAGCEVVTNRLVGALHWIENDPAAMETAADDFWRTVLA